MQTNQLPSGLTDLHSPPPIDYSLRDTWIMAGVLLLIETQLFFAYGLLFYVAGIVAVLRLLAALIRWLWKNDRAGFKLASKRLGIYAAAFALCQVTAAGNNRLAQRHAQTVVAACIAFKQANGRYPSQLRELVPKFLAEIPRAKINVSLIWMNSDFFQFRYRYRPASKAVATDGATLEWTVAPPFLRHFYIFEEARWGCID